MRGPQQSSIRANLYILSRPVRTEYIPGHSSNMYIQKNVAHRTRNLCHTTSNVCMLQRSLRRVREVLHTSVSLHSQQNVFNTKSCLSMYDSKAYDSIEAFNQMQFDHALSRQLQSVQIRARLPLRMYFPSPRAHFKSDAFMGQTWVGVSRVLS